MRRGIDEQRKHKNFSIPKRVAAIAEAGECLRSNVHTVIIPRRSNKHLEKIESDGDLRFIISFDNHIRAIPFLCPGLLVCLQGGIPRFRLPSTMYSHSDNICCIELA